MSESPIEKSATTAVGRCFVAGGTTIETNMPKRAIPRAERSLSESMFPATEPMKVPAVQERIGKISSPAMKEPVIGSFRVEETPKISSVFPYAIRRRFTVPVPGASFCVSVRLMRPYLILMTSIVRKVSKNAACDAMSVIPANCPALARFVKLISAARGALIPASRAVMPSAKETAK